MKGKYFLDKIIYKLKSNLPIFNFVISSTSLYLQYNYLFPSQEKNKNAIVLNLNKKPVTS